MVHFSSDGGGEHIGVAQVLVMFLDQPTVPGRVEHQAAQRTVVLLNPSPCSFPRCILSLLNNSL